MLQPEIAGALRDRKVANIERTRPDAIAAGNIGCMTQIGAGTAIPIVHTVELLDWATGGPKPRDCRPCPPDPHAHPPGPARPAAREGKGHQQLHRRPTPVSLQLGPVARRPERHDFSIRKETSDGLVAGHGTDNNMWLSTLLAAVPVVVLLGAIGLFELKAHVAAAARHRQRSLIAIFVFGMPAAWRCARRLGIAYGLFPIGWIVLNIIFLYRLTEGQGSSPSCRTHRRASPPTGGCNCC